MTPKEASRRLPNGAIELTGAKAELRTRTVSRSNSPRATLSGWAARPPRSTRTAAKSRSLSGRQRRRTTTTTSSVGKAKAGGGTKRDAEGAYRAAATSSSL